MTTVFDRAGQNGMRGPDATPSAEPQVPGRVRRAKRPSWFARDPAWPIVALCAGWPVWWFLGIGDYFPVLLAIPILRKMWLWRVRNERTIRLPPGFAIWAMFLVVVIAGVTVLSLTAPETVPSPTGNRVVSWGLRTGIYLGITVLLVYAGNLTERELPRRRLAFQLGLVGIYAAVGGFIGVLSPHLQFTSPLAYIIPRGIQASNGQLQMMLHPGFTQVQNILGYDVGRSRAPFDYTNMWGNCLAILLPWLIVAWWCYGNRKERRKTLIVLAIAFVPVVYSLDRGLWIGLGLSIAYLALRFAARGKLAMLAGLCAVLALVAIIVVASPLQNLISQRLSHGKSNASRSSLSGIAADDALSSPLIGYGDTRHAIGSPNSIVVGKTLKCHSCGSRDVGGNGQFWMMLITDGFLGAGLYCAFFIFGIWRYWRDPTPYGLVGVLVLILGFPFMLVYVAVGPPLTWTMLGYAVLWKNDRERQKEAAAAAAESAAELRAQLGSRATTARAQA
ncbi:MAG: O-antigen ligase domain-containing protein [Actinobacteria bacterium]|nr:O-antigen ligase domain-containing protein [Actinomycetota bacterium]